MKDSNKSIKYLDTKESEMLTFLESLVNIDSGTYVKGGINKIADIMTSRLRGLGFEVQRLCQRDYGDHLIARKEGLSRKRLLCIGHMDTVFPEYETQKHPFRLEGDKAYGPGIIDMKGGLVVLLFALYALMEVEPDFYKSLNITLLLNSDEEVISPTSTPHIIQEAKSADTVCIFEPVGHRGQVLTKRKGVGRYYLNVYGKAAHAGEHPEMGISAIETLAQKIMDLYALADFENGLTINVGVIKGGSRFNIIADHACAEIDVRILEQDQGDRIQRGLNHLCLTHRQGIRLEISGGIQFPPMLKTKRSTELLGLLKDVGNELNLDIEEASTGAGSDGNHASQYAPTIDGLGPQGMGSHSSDEVLFVPTLIERSKIFTIFVKRWEKLFDPKGDYP